MIPIIATHWNQKAEKFKRLEAHLRDNNIPSWSYFFGYPGRGLKTRQMVGEHMYIDPNELRGACIGQNLLHWNIWSMLKNSAERHPGERSWTIIEDDIEFYENWSDVYGDVLEDIPPDWDMIFFGNCNTAQADMTQVADNLYRGAGTCLHFYTVRDKALDVLLGTTAFFRARIDAQLVMDTYPHLNVYSVLPSLAGQFETHLPT